MNAEPRRLGRSAALWPEELDEIDAPPTHLWCVGRTELLASHPRLAVVGTRTPSPYGLDQAARFARSVAARGVAVVSGMARGIDQAAHAAALEVGGSTLAVLGSAVDRPWPADEIVERLKRDGLLLSEYPPGTGPRRYHFRQRNRLISGLARAVLVVEAGLVSGALITAHWAADQGREVLVLPGRVDQPMARGCHRLLREGASLVESPEELCELMGWTSGAPAGEEDPRDGPGDEHPVLCALVGETLGADELAERLAWSGARILAELAELELAGRVARGPGGLYRRRG